MIATANPFGRLVVAVIALTVVCVPAYFFVVHGNTIDLNAFVYAIPLGAIALAILVTLGNRLVAHPYAAPGAGYGGSFAALSWRYGGHPVLQLTVCLAGLAVVGCLFLARDADVRAFRSDPSCSLVPGRPAFPGTGACRTATARVLGTFTTSGRRGYTYRHVTLAVDGAGQTSVTLAGTYAPAFWRDAVSGADRVADVELYRGRIVALATLAGPASTDGMPVERLTQIFIWAIAFAVGGFVSAVRLLFSSTA